MKTPTYKGALLLCIGFGVGNAISVTLFGGEYQTVLERTYFQSLAIFASFYILRTQ